MPTFRERLVVPWWWWPAAAAVVAVLGGELHLGNSLAWNVGSYVAVAVAVTVVLAGLSHSRVMVSDDGILHAGAAAIPVSSLGPAGIRQGEELRLRLGPGADPTAFLLIRSWVRTAVEIAVVDPQDDTPYWIISTRRPQQLLAALDEVRSGATPSTPAVR